MEFSNIRFNWAFVAAILAAVASLSGATTRELQQEIGAEICFCAPNTYEFELDFSLTCPPVNITLGDAVKATTCMVSPFGNPEIADLVPVRVTSIDVLELNQNLQVMVQESISPTTPYLDGDTFSYVSYAAIPGEIVNPEDLPRAIQLNIMGVNKFEEEIINVYLITFTNSCGAYPVLFGGQWAGWTRFRDLGPPNPELCPIATPPTAAPTPAAPTRVAPTPAAPTRVAPTPVPTPKPTQSFMSMSMSMDVKLEGFSIEDLLEGELEYKEFSKGKGGKKEKSKSGRHKESNKLSKPYSKDGKSKDGKSKDGKSKDGKSKDGKSKDGKSKDGKAKDGKAKDGSKSGNKLTKPGSKDGAKDGKSYKSKDGAKYGKPYAKDGKAKDGSKDGKAKDGSKAGKAKDGSKDGSKDGKAKDGSKAGKSEKLKDTNKLTKPGSKDAKSKDGAKAGKSYTKDGAKAGYGKSDKSKDSSKDGAKAGKSFKYEGTGQKESIVSHKEANKLTKSNKSKGKAGSMRLRI